MDLLKVYVGIKVEFLLTRLSEAAIELGRAQLAAFGLFGTSSPSSGTAPPGALLCEQRKKRGCAMVSRAPQVNIFYEEPGNGRGAARSPLPGEGMSTRFVGGLFGGLGGSVCGVCVWGCNGTAATRPPPAFPLV